MKPKPEPIVFLELGKRPKDTPAGTGWLEPPISDTVVNDGRDPNMRFLTKSGATKFNYQRNEETDPMPEYYPEWRNPTLWMEDREAYVCPAVLT